MDTGFVDNRDCDGTVNLHGQSSTIHVTSLENGMSTKVTLPHLPEGLGECLPDCLCSVIPVDNTGPTHATTLDVDEIYQVLGKDILRSSLLEDIGLYLECEEDSRDALPAQCPGESISSSKSCTEIFPSSEMRLTWTQKGITVHDKQTSRSTCPQCFKTFARETLMKDHRFRVHGYLNLFPCGKCDYQGHSYRLLQKHTSRKHKGVNSRPALILNKKGPEEHSSLSLCPSGEAGTSGNSVYSYNGIIMPQPVETLAETTDVRLTFDGEEPYWDSTAATNSIVIKVKPQDGVVQNIPVPGTECYIITEVVDANGSKGNPTHQGSVSSSCSDEGQDKPYACDECSYKCISSRLLQRHKHSLHNADREVHCCDKCGCVFKQKRSLDTHMKIHGGQFEFHCSKCNKSFASRDHLRLHQRTHIQTRSFECDFPNCNFSFRTNGHLRQHERNVHGPNVFRCPEPGCGKSFALKRLADAHFKLHTASNRCIHASCGRTFRDRHNLIVHQKTHRNLGVHDKKVSAHNGQ